MGAAGEAAVGGAVLAAGDVSADPARAAEAHIAGDEEVRTRPAADEAQRYACALTPTAGVSGARRTRSRTSGVWIARSRPVFVRTRAPSSWAPTITGTLRLQAS
jgi:hypothetical protein